MIATGAKWLQRLPTEHDLKNFGAEFPSWLRGFWSMLFFTSSVGAGAEPTKLWTSRGRCWNGCRSYHCASPLCAVFSTTSSSEPGFLFDASAFIISWVHRKINAPAQQVKRDFLFSWRVFTTQPTLLRVPTFTRKS